MSESRAPALAAVSLATIFGLTGCNTNPDTNAVIGAAAGAAIGAMVGGGNTSSYGGYGPYSGRYNRPVRTCGRYPVVERDYYGYPQTRYVTRCTP